MPTVVAEREVARPRAEIWEFVQDIDRWAPMMPGYSGHERSSETDSTWTLEGDLGPFTRTVQLAVHISERVAPGRIRFELQGIGEDARGGGTFELHERLPQAAPGANEAPRPPTQIPARSWWARLLDWLLGRAPPSLPDPLGAPPAPSATQVVFTFHIEAGGPMGPMINALLGPFADQVAQDLVTRVAAHLDGSAP